eukprot:SAG11_NODE_1994_length_3953_cov_2.436430_5_plen_120_part_00
MNDAVHRGERAPKRVRHRTFEGAAPVRSGTNDSPSMMLGTGSPASSSLHARALQTRQRAPLRLQRTQQTHRVGATSMFMTGWVSVVPALIPGPLTNRGMRMSVSYGSIFSIGMRNCPRW